MVDIPEKKKKIISFLEANGPSLPVRIAKITELDPLLTSAILSELIDSKQVKTSKIRIGSSPLYLLQGQEQMLEEHTSNFKPIEKEAYLKLKENELLVDENESPSIRVALRNIRDFATPFNFQEKIMWKYAFTPDERIKELLNPKKETPKKIEEIKIKEKSDTEEEAKKENKKKTKTKEEEESKRKEKKIEDIFHTSEKREKKSEFLIKIKAFLEKKEIKFLETIQTEKKEIIAKISLSTNLGDINFLLIAKNKKSLTREEISSSIQRATYEKMPCLLIIKKEPSKKIRETINKNHLIKLEILN